MPRSAIRLALLLALLGPPAFPQADAVTPTPAGERPLEPLSLEDLLGLPVVSVSNVSEKLQDAPATVIVLTREDLRRRGYSELSELLDDLPGMDVVRPYGDTYFKDYWRGYRNTIGDPFLILVDGLPFNHLYFNTADVLVTFPLAAIERVEVVYGPTSSVYGANAFMGVINVITHGPAPPHGASGQTLVTAGSFGSRIADVHYGYGRDDLSLSLAARFDDGNLDPASGERYEYTKNAYYGDRQLWGGFVDNPNVGGRFDSPHRQRALDLRLRAGPLELGLSYYRIDAGYGVVYAADRAQNHVVWARPETSLYLKATHDLGPRVTSTSMLRYRRSDVSNDSFFVQSDPGPQQTADFSYWESLNSSWTFREDATIRAGEALSFAVGLRYEQKDLQKAYDINYGPALPAATLDASRYPYPEPPSATPQAQNRITTETTSGYVQGKLRLRKRHMLSLGARHDDNSQYGGSTNVRAGYATRTGPWCLKLLYGEAFQEPTPRLLYGGWTGSGSDPNLRPETSRTFEATGTYTRPRFEASLGLYHVRNQGTLVNTAGGASNLGDRRVTGLEAHVHSVVPLAGLKQLQAWGYYSRLVQADENERASGLPMGPIGDLARDKLHLGLTAVVDRHLTATLLGRWVGRRDTVATNPVGSVPSHTTLDAVLLLDALPVRGLGATLRVKNLFDAAFSDPGIRDASAGVRPGGFDPVTGVWQGSAGFYSSLLPQPGRSLQVTLRLDF